VNDEVRMCGQVESEGQNAQWHRVSHLQSLRCIIDSSQNPEKYNHEWNHSLQGCTYIVLNQVRIDYYLNLSLVVLLHERKSVKGEMGYHAVYISLILLAVKRNGRLNQGAGDKRFISKEENVADES
jgi:hypothetical protein